VSPHCSPDAASIRAQCKIGLTFEPVVNNATISAIEILGES
jgi:hypothetical protein